MDNGKPTVPLQTSDGAIEALQAVAAALEAAVDLAQPHRSTGRCLTIAARVRVAADHPERAPMLLASLGQLADEWEWGG